MKLITFLLIAFLISCLVTLKGENQDLKELIDLQHKEQMLSDSLILELQSSNRIYIDKALGNI